MRGEIGDVKGKLALEDKLGSAVSLMAELLKQHVGMVSGDLQNMRRRLDDGDKRFDLLTRMDARMQGIEEGNKLILKEVSKRPTRRECDARHGETSGGSSDE